MKKKDREAEMGVDRPYPEKAWEKYYEKCFGFGPSGKEVKRKA